MAVLIVIVVLVLVLIVAIVKCYNGLVKLKGRVENQGAQVDVQLKRRADLIPNLLETTKGYAKFEKSTLSNITSLRSQVMNSKNIQESYDADVKLGKMCTQVLALSESYPELKTNTHFLKLQDELTETENKIGVSRQFYNDIVTKYNVAIKMFPHSIIAGMLGFKKIDLLKATAQERESIKFTSEDFSI